MNLILDINLVFPLLLGAVIGGAMAWATCNRLARLDTLRLNAESLEMLRLERISVGQIHAEHLAVLETQIREQRVALEAAAVEMAEKRNEIVQLKNLSKDQIHLLEQRNGELTVRQDLVAGQLAQLQADRDQVKQQHAAELQALGLRHTEQLQKLESPLTVVVHPFVNTEVDEGFIKDVTTVEVGYKYQLMMQGIPCMEPHEVVVERHNKVKVDTHALQAWGEKAMAFADAAIQIKSGGVAKSLMSVAKNIIQSSK